MLTLAAACILIGSAQADTSTKFFVSSFGPPLAAPGSSHVYTLTITNCASGTAGCGGSVSTQTLGSARFAVPAGYQLGRVPQTDATGRGWTLDASTPGQLQLLAGKRGVVLAPGEHVSFALPITPATVNGTYCYSGATPWTWSGQAKQANNFSGTGNDFVDLGDATLKLASLVYTNSPTTANVNEPISAPPGVQVSVIDACGNAVTDATGGVTLAIGKNPNPTGGTLSGGAAQSVASGGTATFSSLSIDAAGSGYTLVASGDGTGTIANLDPVESGSFAIATLCTSTDNGRGCQTVNGGTNLAAAIPPSGDTTQLSLGPLDTTSSCLGKTSIGSLATIIPHYVTPGTVSVTLTYASNLAKSPGTNGYIVCLTKPAGVQALSNCTGSNPAPCIDSKQHPGGGPLTIVLKLNSSDPVGATYR